MRQAREQMKVEIVRPDLSRFAKNINWRPLDLSVKQFQEEWSGQYNAATDVIVSDLVRYDKKGSILSVSEAVSKALEVSKVSAESLSNVPLPAESVEIVWEDPTLPNILVSWHPEGNAINTKPSLFTIWTIKPKPMDQWLPHDGRNMFNGFPYACSAFEIEDVSAAISGSLTNIYSDDVNDDQTKAVGYMNALALKVFAFIAVPEVREISEKPKTRNELKTANVLSRGKDAPVPPGGVTHLRVLPRVAVQNGEHRDSDGTPESSRKFLGRIGHIRHFKSEFFTKARGTWKWIPPIAPPEGIKLRFIVNKAPKVAA